MNILLCSAGRRVKLVKYFKEELQKRGGKVVAADCDSSAPALYLADKAEIVPRITDPEYISHIKQICKKHNIHGVLSLIDPELSLLAEHIDEFEKENIKVIVSNKDVINICFDKFLTYTFLTSHHLPAIPTYIKMEDIIADIEKNELQFPLILKPRKGSASLGISIIHSTEELYALWKETDEWIAQPFIQGTEYGVDCYVDLVNDKTTNIFCKKKIKMRAGETDKSISVHDPALIHLIEQVLSKLNAIGPVDIDCFKTERGYIISEVNPRFGGGYLHAHEEGQNFVINILTNLAGVPNQVDIGNYSNGSVMIKFDDVLILKGIDQILNDQQLHELI
ncbi:carbamoyl-phosphate synthase large subunit [Bacillus sp. SORGH_AS 510]|uniref:ATP-grasp domain-containing protein n=1 Tax=Bacillus sp. SORGH_AS_0510 TaxID=3041771 RepID=UPI0027890B4D|nr:ATP-grasp domain-containing protein [Bacillus sp. SORGH_AS_0510]MDQ1144595.1 carbamoyl-phosphate synthase large subunit [Bacillus sp. SORGH_AS_0510]